MNDYEVNVLVTNISPEVEEQILDELDGTSGHDHAGSAFVSVVLPGQTFCDAVSSVARWLEDRGVHCLRIQEDLVTKTDIAKRLGVTRQAVHQWVSGKRGLSGFPIAANPVAGGVWLWGDVQAWSNSKKPGSGDGPLHPLRDDIDQGNACLRARMENHRKNADLRLLGAKIGAWAGEPAPRNAAGGRPSWGHAVRTSGAYEKVSVQ